MKRSFSYTAQTSWNGPPLDSSSLGTMKQFTTKQKLLYGPETALFIEFLPFYQPILGTWETGISEGLSCLNIKHQQQKQQQLLLLLLRLWCVITTSTLGCQCKCSQNEFQHYLFFCYFYYCNVTHIYTWCKKIGDPYKIITDSCFYSSPCFFAAFTDDFLCENMQKVHEHVTRVT